MSSAAAAALLAAGLELAASHAPYPDGAPPGFSGGFKEESCHACHFHQDLNDASGRVSIDGLITLADNTIHPLNVTASAAALAVATFPSS